MQAVEVFLSSNLNLPLGPVWRGKVNVALIRFAGGADGPRERDAGGGLGAEHRLARLDLDQTSFSLRVLQSLADNPGCQR
jgi:hypothetical protein